MTLSITICLALTALPVLAASMYLAAAAVLSTRSAIPVARPPLPRFDVVVPAHDEERGIATTIASILGVDYPPTMFRTLVIADNCSDRTAERAAAAGAVVAIRNDTTKFGKGYALAQAFNLCLDNGFADAIVVVDADTIVSRNLLQAFAARFVNGAVAVQADYGVQNANASWRTRLMMIALGAFHRVRSLARTRLRLSCGLRGNGMAFSTTLLGAVPYRAFSIVEDVEYGLELGYAGYRVEYVPEATVLGEMPTTESASRNQRERWERGRRALARHHLPRLLHTALARKDPVLWDLALDLMMPPLAQLAAINCAGAALSMVVFCFDSSAMAAVVLWCVAAFGLILYVARGWALSGAGPRGLIDLAGAPVYILWKLMVRFCTKDRTNRWVRTTRDAKM